MKMGYETTLLFISGRKETGYHSVEASLNMCKIAFGEIKKLIDKNRKVIDTKKYEKWFSKAYTIDGNTRRRYKRALNKYREIRNELDNTHLYFFWSSVQYPEYSDCYDDLIVVELEELKIAIESEMEENPYRRWKNALALIELFQSEEWKNDNIKIILYGH